MRAVVIARFGGPEVLELREVAAPRPARGEVLVRVHATAVNRADLLQRMGAYPAPADAPQDIPGLEFAGVVEELGEGVSEVAVGDRVMALTGGGAYAEQVVVHARSLARIPQEMSFTDAAAIPEAFITAYDALVTQAGLASGETVLVHAVGSGVGTAAVQIIRALGAFCIGTSRTQDKLDRAAPFGLNHGLLVDKGAFAAEVLKRTGGAGVDVVLELVGGDYINEDLGCIASRGRIALVGLLAGAESKVSLGLLLRKRVTLFGTVLRSRPLEEKLAASRTFAKHVVPLFERGVLRPVVDRVLPLDRAADAHTYVAENGPVGKVVLRVDPR
jgi:NADPH2:quinone reductase